MSDTWINWRFGFWYFQLGKCFSFVRVFKIKHIPVAGDKWFESYK